MTDAPQVDARKLVGYNNFVRHNPKSDRFPIHKFHHVEFYCGDATTSYKRFQHGLGMSLVAKSDLSTGNSNCASYVLQSNELVFTFTAPLSLKNAHPESTCPLPGYDAEMAFEFLKQHGLAVRAVGIVVDDAHVAHSRAVEGGGVSVLAPTQLVDKATGQTAVISEVKAYGDVVLRFVSGDYGGPFLPNYSPVDAPHISYGLQRLDHAVGNVPVLFDATDYLMAATGFHEFAEFVAADIGTVNSGLNSMVLANNSEAVLMPINEPTFGTARKSQIQTYLEQNEGAGLQHLALKTDDIVATLRQMRARSECGGFEFMPRASDQYYRTLPDRIGDKLTPEQYKHVEELGILVDKDDQGVLLQIFTKPLGDRPTIFVEIIERLGCMNPVAVDSVKGVAIAEGTTAAPGVPIIMRTEQAAGCGGFGKGNFSELFRSIEDYEKNLNV